MRLSEYAKQLGVSYRTAHRWFKSGKIPHKVEQLPSGTIIVYTEEQDEKEQKEVHIYARVSSHDQKNDLERQLERLRNYCISNGYRIISETKEIASGMNQNRAKLNKLLSDKEVKVIVVEHKDRLSRFGFELISSSLSANNREIEVVNETEEKMDLVQDFIDVITSMCARIYGKRSSKNKINKMTEIIKDE